MSLCVECKNLDCTNDGRFKCGIDGEILQHEGEGRGCESCELYVESEGAE